MNVGNTIQPQISIQPPSDLGVAWSSSDNTIATVSDVGVVKGIAAGTVTISAVLVDGTPLASATITVVIPTTGVVFDQPSISVRVGGTATATAHTIPSNATNNTLIWSTNNKAIATVSNTGVIQGISRGRATVSVSSNGFTAKIPINVN